jgi:hypothetical protein
MIILRSLNKIRLPYFSRHCECFQNVLINGSYAHSEGKGAVTINSNLKSPHRFCNKGAPVQITSNFFFFAGHGGQEGFERREVEAPIG